MGGDKHGSKSGRYVGGFLQLFDWNAKSRKKLFSSKYDLQEQPKQGKQSEGNYPMARIRLADEEEYGAAISIRGGSDYSCASSVTDDDGYGTKAPGVVARLMGLDSLPAPNALGLYSSPFFDTLTLGDAPYRGRNLDFYQDPQIMHSRNLLGKVESPPRNALDRRPQKMPSRPIEKFQTEILPPKSAKTIPITHHKLLSPIKSPIFIPSQDAAHIMEAAAKIIEPGLQATPRTRISSAGSSSVPLKVRELKGKLEASQRPSQRSGESNAAKYLKGQPMNKGWNGSADSLSFKVSPSRDDTSTSGKSKGKSISLAIQAKVNVQKRGQTTSNRSLRVLEEQDDSKSVESFKSQSSGPRITNRKSVIQSSTSVLRQNNQKQNCSTYRDRTASKTSATTSTGKNPLSEATSQARQKNSNRDSGTSRPGSRKSSLQDRNSDKEAAYCGVRNVPRKKRSVDGNLHLKNHVTESMQSGKHEKPNHSIVGDRQFNWVEENRRKGMDVVSFTFTAPITRSLPGSEHSRELAESSNSFPRDDRSKSLLSSDLIKLPSPGFNLIGGDDLSVLLEQKLKELSSKLDSSHHDYAKSGTTGKTVASDQQNVRSIESDAGITRENKDQQELGVMDTNNSALLSSEPEQLRRNYIFQEVEALDDYSSTKLQTKQWSDNLLPSPVSILDPFLLTESCYSESLASSSTEESKQCSSVQAQEVFGSHSRQKTPPMETEADTSDSASSTSTQTVAVKESIKPNNWELGYIKGMLCNIEPLFKDYATGRTSEIINPHLFYQMERRWVGLKMGENYRFDRKVLFDGVSESLDLKCQHFVGGGFKLWTKGTTTMKRKERLAEEVYKEIQGWRNLVNNMVDELVDKDMSSKYGRWLNFEVDEFLLGVEIEDQILDYLIVEAVADILASNLSLR